MRNAGSPVLVVGVMSSARLNGNTATLVRAALSAAAEAGAQTAEVELKGVYENLNQRKLL